MNDAIFKFKRYEDSSLVYTGLDRHEGEDIGGWDTVIKRKEYERLFFNQQATLKAEAGAVREVPPEFMSVVTFDEGEEEVEDKAVEYKPKKRPSRRALTRSGDDEPFEPESISKRFGVKAPVVEAKPAPVEEKPKVDTSAVAVGVTVNHDKFGSGKVLEMKGDFILVSFREGTKKFMFPDAFEKGFLYLSS